MAPGDRSSKRAALPDEVLLADELVEAARSHPGSQGLALGRWLEERLGPGAGWSPRWHGRMVAPFPSSTAARVAPEWLKLRVGSTITTPMPIERASTAPGS